MQPLTVIHQNVLQILSKSIHKIEIQRSEDIHGLNKGNKLMASFSM